MCIVCRNMKGIEYMLLHVQEPILYVVRKVHRQAPDKGAYVRGYIDKMQCSGLSWFCVLYTSLSYPSRKLLYSERNRVPVSGPVVYHQLKIGG